MRDDFLIILIPAAALIVASLFGVSRADDLLRNWCEKNGFRLMAYQRRHLRLGPFFLTSSRGQVVFYVTVERPDGSVADCWVRCGSFFFGLLSKQVDVRWVNPPTQTHGFPVMLPPVDRKGDTHE